MIRLTVLFFIAVYIILASLFVYYVRKKTERKIYRWLAVAFVLLLPTWDVLLGFIVYRVAVITGMPSEVIYETAQTDGIYYEGMNDKLISRDDGTIDVCCFLDDAFKNKFEYVEAKITKQSFGHGEKIKIPPRLYKCEPLPTSEKNPSYFPVKCFRIEKPTSQYSVIASDFKLGIVEINTKKIINLSSGKLMAQYRRVVSHGYLGIPGIWLVPFFNWLHWWDTTPHGFCSPDCADYYSFEYKVLTTKQ